MQTQRCVSYRQKLTAMLKEVLSNKVTLNICYPGFPKQTFLCQLIVCIMII